MFGDVGRHYPFSSDVWHVFLRWREVNPETFIGAFSDWFFSYTGERAFPLFTEAQMTKLLDVIGEDLSTSVSLLEGMESHP